MLSLHQIQRGVQIAATEYPIKKAELFGSYAEDRAREGSDVDLLIEFTSPSVSLITLSSLRLRLEELLSTPVDVVHAPPPADSLIEIRGRIAVYGA